jgi:hypothetical protein
MDLKAVVAMVAVLCACGVKAGEPAAQEKDIPAVETLVLIGEKIAIEEKKSPCEVEARESGEHRCIIFDALYGAAYRIVEPIVGRWPDATIPFDIADHYGFPGFGYTRHALLFIAVAEDGIYLHKYQGVPMLRTADGGWASCGGLGYGEDALVPRPLRFSEDLGPVVASTVDDLSVRSQKRDIRVRDGRVHCMRGVPLPDVYEYIRQGVMQAREIDLPAWAKRDAVP